MTDTRERDTLEQPCDDSRGHNGVPRPATIIIAMVAATAAMACVAYRGGRIQPGVALPMSEPSRDPTPTRDPTEIYAPIREHPSSDRTSKQDWNRPWQLPPRLQEIAATLAAFIAGGIPLLQLTITFDENALVEPAPARPIPDADSGADSADHTTP